MVAAHDLRCVEQTIHVVHAKKKKILFIVEFELEPNAAFMFQFD